ncbi:protoporphyrinogen oxidase [Cimex lectularius]|uniref:Protoporphyrinogen oxidase n=1 Tax=Cimex lectularius TaxID=79782 RepID=A0A8I6THA7_CIMLE|nr:protoporphyrinogen oxidase [Cimex lectularius]XP_024082255.1 protoporphyrinogen oxidase [Cimex lectularius]
MTLIIGGGISGLSAAYYLLKHSKKAVVTEAGKAVGGWIQSVRDEKTGLIYEKGPRTLRIKGNVGANTLSLIEEIGLGEKVRAITADRPSSKNKLIYVNGSLHYLPTEFSAFFKKVSPFSKPLITALLRDLFVKKVPKEDESVHSFVERRFGSEIADYLTSSMLCGICAGNSKEISVKFLMPYLFDLEQKYGSVGVGFIKETLNKKPKPKVEEFPGQLGKKSKEENWVIFGLEGGLNTFPKKLSEKVLEKGGDILLDSEVTKLTLNKNSVTYELNGKIDECGHVISSLPTTKLAPLLQHQHPWLSEQLSSIEYVSVAVVNVAYKGHVLKYNAFGYLIPPSQELPVLGAVFDSCNLPQGDWTVLTLMMGGYWYDKFFGKESSPEFFLETALKYNEKILDIKEKPESYHCQLMKEAIPQYVIGHHEKVNKMLNYVRDKCLPISLIGSAFKGIGVNDVILSAKAAVDNIVR